MRDPGRAVPEVADLIGQVRRRDPDQARELYERTVSRIDAESRRRLDAMLSRDAATQDPNGPRELDLGLAVPNGDSVETRSITVPPTPGGKPQEDVPDDPGQDDPDELTNLSEPEEPEQPDKEKCQKMENDIENVRLEIEDKERFVDSARENLRMAEEEYDKRRKEYAWLSATVGLSEGAGRDEGAFALPKRLGGVIKLFTGVEDISAARDRVNWAADAKQKAQEIAENARRELDQARARHASLVREHDVVCRRH